MNRESAKKAGLQAARRSEAYRRGMEMLPKDAKGVKLTARGAGLEFHYVNAVGLEMTVWSPFIPTKLVVI